MSTAEVLRGSLVPIARAAVHPFHIAYHSSVLLSNKILVFGGTGTAPPFIFALDYLRKRWEVLYRQVPVEFRRSSCTVSVVWHTCIYAFGGSVGVMPLRDLFAFDLVLEEFQEVSTRGTPPPSRWGASGDFCEATKDIVVIGGLGSDSRMHNDVWLLGLESLRWRQPFVGGSAPSPRKSHATCSNQDTVYLFGGCSLRGEFFHDLHLLTVAQERCVWSSPVMAGPTPGSHFRAELALFRGMILIIGGIRYGHQGVHLAVGNVEAGRWLRLETDTSDDAQGDANGEEEEEECEVRFEGRPPTSIAHKVVVLGSKEIVSLGGTNANSDHVYSIRSSRG